MGNSIVVEIFLVVVILIDRLNVRLSNPRDTISCCTQQLTYWIMLTVKKLERFAIATFCPQLTGCK